MNSILNLLKKIEFHTSNELTELFCPEIENDCFFVSFKIDFSKVIVQELLGFRFYNEISLHSLQLNNLIFRRIFWFK